MDGQRSQKLNSWEKERPEGEGGSGFDKRLRRGKARKITPDAEVGLQTVDETALSITHQTQIKEKEPRNTGIETKRRGGKKSHFV